MTSREPEWWGDQTIDEENADEEARHQAPECFWNILIPALAAQKEVAA